MKKSHPETMPPIPVTGDEPIESKISFQEYQGQAAYSPVLLAGVAHAIKRDGGARKRTVLEWNQAVEVFASASTQ